MRLALLLSAALCVAATATLADTIVLWDFNSPIADGTNSTGTLVPAMGTGTASSLGGVTESFVGGSTKDAAADNSSWSTSKYPPLTTSNLEAGVRFDAGTVGFENISLSWYQQNSATATRYLRLQYTLDGATFVNAEVIGIYKDGSFTNQVADLTSIPGAANNPNFGFRLLAEFEDSATGAGTNAYVATKDGSSYNTGGTIRFDLVTVSGTPIFDGNTPPYILSSIPSQTLRPNQSTAWLPFTVLDAEDPARTLTLAKVSSNPSVIPVSNITFAGTNASRTLQVKAGSQEGAAVVTVYVLDSGGKSNSISFNVTVLPENLPPFISNIGPTNTLAGTTAGPIAFTVGDDESPATSLAVSGSSANPALVPNSGLVFSGSGSNRTVTITPVPGQTGVAPITLTVSDGAKTSSASFALVVTPSASVLLLDPFTYADGSVVTHSGFLWNNRSGADGDCQVSAGRLAISADLSEDIVAPLIGAPYYPSNTANLYAAFKVTVFDLPKQAPGYFAHFSSGTTLRARLFAGTTNAWSGFRFFVANGDGAPEPFPVDVQTNTTHTLVTRYHVATATTTLWLDPAAETDAGVTATDEQSPYRVASYGFRQDPSLGAVLAVDDVRVGLTFASVLTTNNAVLPVPLTCERNGGSLVLRWSDPAFGLQAAPSVAGPFTNVTGAASPVTIPATGPAKFFRLKTP